MEGKVVIKTKLYKPKEIYMGERERERCIDRAQGRER